MEIYNKPLFIFEIANNHQGDLEHGKNLIKALNKKAEHYKEMFNFAVKFQYRDIDTFIHKDYINRDDTKNVKRFRETRLDSGQFTELLAEVRAQGFYAICTPFDEASVDLILTHGYDMIKIPSCSFTDWPLLEKIARAKKPVIASTAGAALTDIRRVVNFFTNRKLDFSIMHCVAEYPVSNDDLQMNQIDLYHAEFPGIRIGFSTHESPDATDPIKIAVAKGAVIFEKHVGLPTESVSLNAYSATPEQVGKWLASAAEAYTICGIRGERYLPNEKEMDDLAALQRGVFAKRHIQRGDKLGENDFYLAFPCLPGQLLAKHLSKYNTICLTSESVRPDAPIFTADINITDNRADILRIVTRVMDLIRKSSVVVPIDSTCEISHHFGINKFDEVGVTIINCINREYCKKILVVLPGQRNPEHTHHLKEETFTVLYGSLSVKFGSETRTVTKGESITIERGAAHEFCSDIGCVFEEISTTHNKDDSFYGMEEAGFVNPRKTEVYITREMLK